MDKVGRRVNDCGLIVNKSGPKNTDKINDFGLNLADKFNLSALQINKNNLTNKYLSVSSGPLF